MKWPLVVLVVVSAIAGCARTPPGESVLLRVTPDARASAEQCREWLLALDEWVDHHGVRDASSQRVLGHPQLRVTRALALLMTEDIDSERFVQQVAFLQALDNRARAIELAHGPKASNTNSARKMELAIERCARVLTEHDLHTREHRGALRERITVPDAYRTWARVLGVYPLTALGFLAGVDQLHQRLERSFLGPIDALPVAGQLVRYMPRVAAGDESATHRSMPVLDPFRSQAHHEPWLKALFAQHAPVFEVDVASDDDRIGVLSLDARGDPFVDVSTPQVYQRVSYARIAGALHLQLNYLLWFPARTPSHALDLLGGDFDGLIWRVTLNHDGHVLAFDSVHQCGCYYLLLPGRGVTLRAPRPRFEEPVFSPRSVPAGEGRVVVRIAHRTHYVQRVYRDGVAARAKQIEYQFADDEQLRSRPLPGGGRASMFNSEGLLEGSERGERWFFWPMGVPSAGAMRQWGHHAIAFVGRRHFDDPDLLDRLLKPDDTARRHTERKGE